MAKFCVVSVLGNYDIYCTSSSPRRRSSAYQSSNGCYFLFIKFDDLLFLAEEEESGNVFISPLLTPGDEVFNPEADLDQEELRRRESTLRPSMPRTSTAERLEELAKRFSLHPNQGSGVRPVSEIQNGSLANVKPLVTMKRSTSDPDAINRDPGSAEGGGENQSASGKQGGRKIGVLMRSMTSFLQTPNQEPSIRTNSRSSSGDSIHMEAGEPRQRLGSDSARHRHGSDSSRRKRNDSDLSKLKDKVKKDRSKSFVFKGLGRNRAQSEQLADNESKVTFDTERPTFSGLDIQSAVERRATIVAPPRRTQSVASMSGMAYLNDGHSTPTNSGSMTPTTSDPIAKMMLVDEKKREAANRRVSIVTGMPSLSLLVSQTIQETSFIVDPTKGGVNGKFVPPPKFGDILSQLGPDMRGWRLEVQHWWALVKLRALLLLHDKCNVLVRLVVPIVLTVLAVAVSHATTTSTATPHQQPRIHLLHSGLHYRNLTGIQVYNDRYKVITTGINDRYTSL
jgi:hypothetical protein